MSNECILTCCQWLDVSWYIYIGLLRVILIWDTWSNLLWQQNHQTSNSNSCGSESAVVDALWVLLHHLLYLLLSDIWLDVLLSLISPTMTASCPGPAAANQTWNMRLPLLHLWDDAAGMQWPVFCSVSCIQVVSSVCKFLGLLFAVLNTLLESI